MTTPLIEQELYLLECYATPDYFKKMLDTFRAMIDTGYAALDEFMKHLPRNYRALELWQQPDIVWGERVLPNLSDTAQWTDEAYERLVAGDLRALHMACNVGTAFSGMRHDYLHDWMPEPFRTEFDRGFLASKLAGNIDHTAHGYWCFGNLYYPTWAEEKENWRYCWETLTPPKTWPIYKLNPSVQVKTDEKVLRSGLYLPQADESCPQFLIEGDEAWEANVGLDGFEVRSTRAPTLWTLVERVADEGGPIPGEEPWRIGSADVAPDRIDGGQPCPADGYWWTPAKDKSRAHFNKGDTMPDYPSSQYGATIWYREK